MILNTENKWAKDAAKAVECVAIDVWKVERLCKKTEKDAAIAEKHVMMAMLVS